MESNRPSMTPQQLVKTVAQYYEVKYEDIMGSIMNETSFTEILLNP